MNHEVQFLLGVFLAPLAAVALLSAWAESRKPWSGAVLAIGSAGLLAHVWLVAPDGLPDWRMIPQMTIDAIAPFLR